MNRLLARAHPDPKSKHFVVLLPFIHVYSDYHFSASNLADACTKALGSVKIGEFEPKLHGYADL